jgi:hypothetical protein
MTTAYTSLLGLALPVTGELSGTWGDTVNNSITSLLDSAIAGTTTISSDADVTLTTTTGAANTSREAILLWTAGGTVTRNITAPAQSKTYIVINASSSTQSIVLRGVGPTTGVTIIKGEAAVCAWNGTDFIKVSNISGPGTFTDLTVTGNTSLGDADTDTITQAASYVTGTQLKSAKTATNTLNLAAYDTDGLAYTNLVTLTASTTPTLALTSTGVGTINNMSIGATTASTGAFTTLSNTTTFTRTATTQNWLDGSMTSATWIVGGTAQTGAITLGRSTGAQTLNLATGATLASTTKAINIGTTGVSTSVTTITSGSSVAGALVTHTWNAGANNMTLDSSGNVGIGTTSPSQKLEVFASANSLQIESVVRNDQSGTGVAAIGFNVSSSALSETTSTKAGIGLVRSSTYGVGSLCFYNNNTLSAGNFTTADEKMRIDSSGNVGIGTSSPGEKLDVQSSADVKARIYTTGATLSTQAGLTLKTGSYEYLIQNFTTTAGSAAALRFYDITASVERMRIDSSGNVGIGTTSPSSFSKLAVLGSDGTGFTGITSINSNTSTGIAGIQFASDSTYIKAAIGLLRSDPNGKGSIVFYNDTNADAANWSTGDEKMRIDPSGNLFLNCTSSPTSNATAVINAIAGGDGINLKQTADGSNMLNLWQTGTSAYSAITFNKGNTQTNVGSITVSTTATSYNTSSDYRLKESIAPMTGALAKIAALKPVTYKWKLDGSDAEGFIAHELQEVVPDCVTGEKDAVDADGSPIYQGIDTSFLIATLTAAIQELKAELDAYKSTHP